MTPYFGREQHYFIGRESYKAFDESSNWVQLYNSKTNTYYYFNKDKSVQKIDGLTKTSQKVVVTKLDKQESIAGYDCKSVRIDADNTSTIHYYCPSIKTTSSIFAKHNFGNWNTYLEATNGALSLKFVLTDRKNGYIMTAVAKEITKMGLNENDFKLPDDVSLRK